MLRIPTSLSADVPAALAYEMGWKECEAERDHAELKAESVTVREKQLVGLLDKIEAIAPWEIPPTPEESGPFDQVTT